VPVWGNYDFTALDIEFDMAFAPGAPGVNPYSARGLKGTLSPVAAARGDDKLRRTVNGALISIAAPQMRKYRLEVQGSDTAPPALDGLWVGMGVTVNSHVELAYLTSSVTASRVAVPGSERFDGRFTYYCPQFYMLVVEYQIEREEWGAVYGWSMALEEV
jgi:hypothetical protein